MERFQAENSPAAVPAPDASSSSVEPPPTMPVKPRETSPAEAPLFSEITVAKDGSGQFRSLGAALPHAADGATITVLDEGPYAESLRLAQRPNGLRLLSPRRAVLRSAATGDGPLLELRNVHDVTVRGFRLETEAGGGADTILTTGSVAATLEDLQFVPGSARRGGALVRCDAQGAKSQLVLRDCRLTLPSRGTGVWIDGRDPPGSVEIVDNQFTGPVSQLIVFGSCRRLRIAGNVFDGATNAINLDLQRWHAETNVEIANNTFVRTRFWLGLLQTFKNVAARGPGCRPRLQQPDPRRGTDPGKRRATGSCPDPVAVRGELVERDATTQPGADRNGRIAQFAESLQVPERDAADAPGFLRPAAESPLVSAGAGGDLPQYVGAKAPQP